MANVLDNPIWHALAGRQAALGVRRADAARYRKDVSVLAGYTEPSTEALRTLSTLTQPGDFLVALGIEEVEKVGPEWRVHDPMSLVQMVCEVELAPPDLTLEPLGPADVDEILKLVEVTQPGPFGRGTIEMGCYTGLREEGELIAMAGERLAPPGHTEISAVCTLPDRRRRGLGEALVRAVGSAIQGRGEIAFLHVLAENTRAIALYERLGFVTRRVRDLTPIVRK